MSHILLRASGGGASGARYQVTEPGDSKQTDDSIKEDEGIDTDYADLIAGFGAPDSDDEEAFELDHGVNFELPGDSLLDTDDETVETDFTGEHLFPEGLPSDLADDAPVDNLGFEAIELPQVGDTNDEESELPLDAMLDGELPPLDADPNDEPEIDPIEAKLNTGVEQRAVKWADRRYVEALGGYGLEPCYVLSGNERTLYAAGKTVFKLALERSTSTEPTCEITQIAELDYSALSMIHLPLEDLLCATMTGQLLSIDRNGRVRNMTGVLASLPRSTFNGAAVQLTLHGQSVRLLFSDGSLARSDDRGATFQIEPEAPAMLKLATGPEQLAIARGRDRSLWKFSDGAWHELGAASTVLRQFLSAANDTSVLLAAAGEVVLVGELQRGLLLSTDGGRHFDFLAGSTGVTALWADRVAGQPLVLVTTHQAVAGLTDLMKLDFPGNELLRLLELPLAEPRDGSGNFDGATEDEDGVLAIHYEPQTQAVWLAGGFGLRRFTHEPIQ